MRLSRQTLVIASVAIAAAVTSSHAAEAPACRTADRAPIAWAPAPYPAGSRVFHVGPHRDLKLPSEAAKVAKDGDVVEIEAADYTDTAIWKQNNLWIRGINGRPHLRAPQPLAQGKGIWVITGIDVVVENVEMSGARVSDRNGAGIRSQGKGLTVRASCFHDNENGILTSNDAANWLVVEFSEFARNGFGDGKSHNLYVGRVSKFEMRYSYSHGARQGHLVKSRAASNLIEYNRLIDDSDGTASYELDLPSGGESVVRGNIIVQSASSPNQTMVSYAAEKKGRQPGSLTMEFNTLFSLRNNPVFVANRAEATAVIANNLFAGAAGTLVTGAATEHGNLFESGSTAFGNPSSADYSLKPGSRAVDAAQTDAHSAGTVPKAQPSAWLAARPRESVGLPDIGAIECCSSRTKDKASR